MTTDFSISVATVGLSNFAGILSVCVQFVNILLRIFISEFIRDVDL